MNDQNLLREIPGATSIRQALAVTANEIVRIADTDLDRALLLLDDLEVTILEEHRRRYNAGKLVDLATDKRQTTSVAIKSSDMAPRDAHEEWSNYYEPGPYGGGAR